MLTKTLIFLCWGLVRLSSASDECTDKEPWNCDFDGLLDEDGWFSGRINNLDIIIFLDNLHKGNTEPIPETFDAREKWPFCKTISNIKNQGACNSCWALCAAQTFSDRYCIATNGKESKDFSTQDLLVCCKSCKPNNNKPPRCPLGGYVAESLQYLVEDGVVSSECKEYDPVVANGTKCERTCSNKDYPVQYKDDIRKAQAIIFANDTTMAFSEREIQIEIMKYGPLCAGIILNTDFRKYFKGSECQRKSVYSVPHQNETKWDVTPKGGHAVRVIGWGVQDDVPYWLLANTWGPEWGDKGFFKLRRGVYEMNIGHKFYGPSMRKAIGISRFMPPFIPMS